MSKRFFLVLTTISLISIVYAQNKSIDALTTKFNTGHYYTLEGKRVDGELKMACQAKFGTLPHNSFYFKGSDGKQVRYTTKDATSFVIGTDSFIVIKNLKHNDAELPEDFAHVDATDGDITTVTHYTTVGNDGTATGLTLYIKRGVTYASLKEAQKAKK